MGPSTDLDWSEFFRTYRAVAVRFVGGLVGQPELAEDLFQDAARAMLQRSAAGELELAGRTHARNYLFRALRNLAVSAARSQRPTAALESEPATRATDPLNELETREEGLEEARRRLLLDEAVRALASAEREALGLRFGEALTYREMSERTGTAISTLQARVEAALEKIRSGVGKGTARA